jgi:hypothetical protein
MQCDKCQTRIEAGEEKSRNGRVLCEDCYLDDVSQVKVCDPWTVYCAKSLEQHSGSPPALTPLQAEIMQVLTETGSMQVEALLERFNLTLPQLETEFAALRHMEKVRGERRDERIFITLW